MKTVACQTLNALVKTPHQWKKGPGVGKDMMPSQKDRCRELMTRIRIRELQPEIDDQDQQKKIMRIKMHKLVLSRWCC